MIKAEELRLGNWLLAKEFAGSAHNIQVDSIATGYRGAMMINVYSEGTAYGDSSIEGISLEKCDPIGLTREILEKCGFEVKLDWLYTKESIALRYITKKSLLDTEELETKFFRWDGFCDIYYLHHLQNIFYVITGKELEINL